MKLFKFYNKESFEIKQETNTKIVVVPEKVCDKFILFKTISSSLNFPYFGNNWNALYDCLMDLSFVHETRIIVLHQDMPLINSPEDMRIYIEILFDVLVSWENDSAHELIVLFPEPYENEISLTIERYITRDE